VALVSPVAGKATAAAGGQAPDAVAPPPGHPRFELLDSLRGIAVMGPIIGHAAYLGGAVTATFAGGLIANTSIAPTVFFVLSSFLLYRPFVAGRLLGAPAPTFREYGRRRLLRIVPAYWVILTLLAIYPGLPGVFSHDWWKYYGFLQIYTAAPGGIIAAWTVCIEVSFYLALPLYVMGIGRLTRGLDPRRAVRRELAVLAALGLGSAALRAVDLAVLGTRLQLSLLETFLWFAIGLWMAVLSVSVARGDTPRALAALVRRPALCWVGAAVLYVVLAVVLENPSGRLSYSAGQWIAYHFLSAGIAVLAFVPAAFSEHRRSLPRRVLRVGVLGWVGVISYSLYLWQGGVVQTLYNHGAAGWVPGHRAISLVLATLGVSFILGATSYYLLERPLLRFKSRGFYFLRASGATTRATR
jgi:peptidoglycan/LPS O-acetylase OafA/YrhL